MSDFRRPEVPFAARLYGRVPRTRVASSKAFPALLSLIQARAAMHGRQEATLADWNHVRAQLVSIIQAYRDHDLPYLSEIKPIGGRHG